MEKLLPLLGIEKKSNKFDVDLVSRMMFTSRKISE